MVNRARLAGLLQSIGGTGPRCRHPDLYYATRLEDSVEWLCPSCRDIINLGPEQCSHVGLTLGTVPGWKGTAYRCVVKDCKARYPRPARR